MLEAAWRRDVLCCSEERENRPAQQTREFHHIRTSSVREEYVGSDAAEICCTSFVGCFLGGLAIYPTSRLACEATEMGEELMAIRNLLSTCVRFANAICGLILPAVATILIGAASADLAGIAHMAFRVDDVVRARDFYKRLGFEQ